MAVSAVGTASPQRVTSGFTSVASAWGATQTRTAGNLLVAVLGGGCTTVAAWSVSENSSTWTSQLSFGNNASGTSAQGIAIFTKTAAGGDAAPSFNTSISGTGVCSVTLLELSGANTTSPVDVTGKYQSGGVAGAVTFSVTTSGNVTAGGEYAISVFGIEHGSASQTWTETGTGWSSLQNDSVTSVSHTQTNTQAAPTSGTTLSDSGHFTSTTNAFGVGAIVVIAASAVQGTAALAGAGSVTANAALAAPAAVAGAGWLGGSSLYGSGTYGGGAYDGPPAAVAAIQGAGATPAGAGTLSPPAYGAASIAGAGSVTAPVILQGTATLTGQGSLAATGISIIPGTASLAGAGSVALVPATQQAGAVLPGAGSITPVPAVQQAGAALAGQSSINASPFKAINGTATLAGQGQVAAAATGQAGAALAGAGHLEAVAGAIGIHPAVDITPASPLRVAITRSS